VLAAIRQRLESNSLVVAGTSAGCACQTIAPMVTHKSFMKILINKNIFFNNKKEKNLHIKNINSIYLYTILFNK
jgi:hypothetical protein